MAAVVAVIMVVVVVVVGGKEWGEIGSWGVDEPGAVGEGCRMGVGCAAVRRVGLEVSRGVTRRRGCASGFFLGFGVLVFSGDVVGPGSMASGCWTW